ncbi:hypothetical protein EV426DRAFT_616363, partial [Tirmania nivea]
MGQLLVPILLLNIGCHPKIHLLTHPNPPISHSQHMSMNLYIFTRHIYFARYGSVHFTVRNVAKHRPAGVAWGLMHIPAMMHYPVMYG